MATDEATIEEQAQQQDTVEQENTSVESGESTEVEATGDSGEQTADESSQEESSETYADFALPDGVTMNEGLLESALPLFKELGLNQEQAQKLVDFQAQQVQAGQQEQIDAFNQLKTDWLEQAKSDKDIGGDNFERVVADAKSAIDKFGNDGLKQLMDDYGIGNHPEVIRFMANVGKLTKEDIPDTGGSIGNGPRDRVSVLYPEQS